MIITILIELVYNLFMGEVCFAILTNKFRFFSAYLQTFEFKRVLVSLFQRLAVYFHRLQGEL